MKSWIFEIRVRRFLEYISPFLMLPVHFPEFYDTDYDMNDS